MISDSNTLEVVRENAECKPNVPGGCAPGTDQYAATGEDIADLTNVSLRAMARTLYTTLVTQVWPTWDTGVTQSFRAGQLQLLVRQLRPRPRPGSF
jgi:hypothetical protein